MADAELEKELRTVLQRDDDYRRPGNPVCNWEDEKAREQLVDALAKDALALLLVLEDRTCSTEVTEAAQLLATVVGQDLEQTSKGGRVKYFVSGRLLLVQQHPGHGIEVRAGMSPPSRC